MMPSPVKLPTVPPYRCTTAAARLTNPAMISRSRFAPTAGRCPLNEQTSAKRTVTCLYSADWVACLTGVPLSYAGTWSPAVVRCRTTHTAVPPLSAPRDYCHPRQYRVTAGQRCPPYRRATSDTNF